MQVICVKQFSLQPARKLQNWLCGRLLRFRRVMILLKTPIFSWFFNPILSPLKTVVLSSICSITKYIVTCECFQLIKNCYLRNEVSVYNATSRLFILLTEVIGRIKTAGWQTWLWNWNFHGILQMVQSADTIFCDTAQIFQYQISQQHHFLVQWWGRYLHSTWYLLVHLLLTPPWFWSSLSNMFWCLVTALWLSSLALSPRAR